MDAVLKTILKRSQIKKLKLNIPSHKRNFKTSRVVMGKYSGWLKYTLYMEDLRVW